MKGIRVGIVGVSGYGGGELLRLCEAHAEFELTYVAGESSAGAKLIERFPSLGKYGQLVIQKWEPSNLPSLDILFALTDLLNEDTEQAGWSALSEESLHRIWDNDQDAAYDNWETLYDVSAR